MVQTHSGATFIYSQQNGANKKANTTVPSHGLRAQKSVRMVKTKFIYVFKLHSYLACNLVTDEGNFTGKLNKFVI